MPEFETKDSGERQQWESGMQRDTQKGKPRFALMWTKRQPYDEQMVTRYAKLLARGAEKYDDRNWEEGAGQEELDYALESLGRHTAQLICGETDEDHAAAVWFNTQLIEYLRWRMAENAKSPTMTLDFNFAPNVDGKTLLEIMTGDRKGVFIRGDVAGPRNPIGGGAATPEGREAALRRLQDETNKPDLPEAPAVAAFDGSKSGDGFIVARETHQAVLDDWHGVDKAQGIPPATPGAANDPSSVQLYVNGKVQAVSANVDGVLKKRADGWLQHFNMELLAGDLGDPHVLISQEEFSDRIKNTPGVRWQAMRHNLPKELIPVKDRVIDTGLNKD